MSIFVWNEEGPSLDEEEERVTDKKKKKEGKRANGKGNKILIVKGLFITMQPSGFTPRYLLRRNGSI